MKMKGARSATTFLNLSFLAVIFSAGLIQLGLEARRGDRPQALDIFRQKPTAANLRAYEQNLEKESWLAAKLRPWMQYAQLVLFNDGGEKALAGRNGWWFYKPGVQYLTERPGISTPRSAKIDPVPAIVSFRDQLAGRGIKLLVVPAPNKESIYPDRLTRRARHLSVAICPETQDVLRRLKEADVELIDLFELYRDAKRTASPDSPSALYLAQDSHWSPAGAQRAAEAVARRILERGWLQPGSVDYLSKPRAIERLGDVLGMLQIPRIERSVAPEKISCEQIVHPGTARPYDDEASSPILVLGDSFFRIYQTDSPGAAGFIAHLAKELKQPVASIVNDGGASTLVRQDLFRRPALLANKKVVIWEFVERDIRFGMEGWQIVPLPPSG